MIKDPLQTYKYSIFPLLKKFIYLVKILETTSTSSPSLKNPEFVEILLDSLSSCVTRGSLAVMGKAEGSVAREEWHGHVTALSVAPEFRRLGLAAKLMEMLEEISERSVPSRPAAVVNQLSINLQITL